MRRLVLVAPLALFMYLVPLSATVGGGLEGRTGIAVWDTLRPVSAPLRLFKNDWTVIPLDKTADAFKGDAIVSNGQIAAVLRQQEPVVEVHAVKGGGTLARLRLRLQTSAGEPAVSLVRVALIENAKAGATLQATYKTAKGAELTAKFRIKQRDVAVQVEPGDGAGKLRVECPGRFVIMPDFFADDIIIDARKLPLTAVDLPSENFLLHPTAGGGSIAMCVFENRQQDVKVTLAGKGEQREVTGSEIGFEKKKIWIALMEAPNIWHMREVAKEDTDKIIKLDWKMPFPAQWRVGFTRPGDVTDSWEMVLQDRGYLSYTKHSWLGADEETISSNRERWNTVLGTFRYPCWTDSDQQGYLQPIKSKKLEFVGPTLIYPIHRLKSTPTDAYTVADVLRNTLGGKPCGYLLDVEGQKTEYRGQATCGVRDILNPIYTNNQQKERRAEVEKTVNDGLIFTKHVRGRIEAYVTFSKKMQKYLAEQRKAHPDLADFIDEMDKLTKEIDNKYAARADKINKLDYVAKLNEEFKKNVLGYEGDDALKRCKAYTHALWVVGDNQDELSGECRWAARMLRQRAAIAVALDARVAPIATEIRNRTQEVLRNPAWHEGARH